MASAGQLKTKIDVQKKKIADKGKTLSAERQRQMRKRLKRLQRSRRVKSRAEARAKRPAKAVPEAAEPAPAQA